MRKYHNSWQWSNDDAVSAWEAAEKRCGELQGQLKSQRELHELVEGELRKLLKRTQPCINDYLHIFDGDCIEDLNMIADLLEDIEKGLADD